MFNPFHLRCRLCRLPEASDDFSPLVPIYRRPSAVPAAIIPVGDIDRESMNGGDKETPEDGGATAERQGSVCTLPDGGDIENTNTSHPEKVCFLA